VHNASKLAIKVKAHKSESLTPRQNKVKEEKKIDTEMKRNIDSSLNESDFDNYESISSGNN
jgi:hypothetical protein